MKAIQIFYTDSDLGDYATLNSLIYSLENEEISEGSIEKIVARKIGRSARVVATVRQKVSRSWYQYNREIERLAQVS